jgi:hypothetical protein
MAQGYVRQAAANIQPGLRANAEDVNTELNQLQNAFDNSSGHDHTGSVAGDGAKLSLSASMTGVLPVANGGTGTTTSTGSGSVVLSVQPTLTGNPIFSNNVSIVQGLAVNSGSFPGNGQIVVGGATAAILYNDRTLNQLWSTYAAAGDFRIASPTPTEVLTINGAGNLTVTGTVTTGGSLAVLSAVATPNVISAQVPAGGVCYSAWTVNTVRTWTAGTLPDGRFSIIDQTASGAPARIIIDTAGNCSNQTGTWAAISDPRTKENMQPWSQGLEAVLALNPITFNYNGKGGTSDDGQTHLGLDAAEVQAVLPDLVLTRESEDVPDLLSVDLGKLVFPLINCIKELHARIKVLEEAR